MLLNEIRPSSHNLSLIQSPFWLASDDLEEAATIAATTSLSAGENDFILLTDAIRAALSSGRSGAVALLRVRTTRPTGRLSFDGTATNGFSDEQTPFRFVTLLDDLAVFLTPRLAPVKTANQEYCQPATARYGAFTLLVWQQDRAAAELANHLDCWRKEYYQLKQADFVAGVAAASDAGGDLLSLLCFADEALTEAHSARRVVCFDPATTALLSRQISCHQTVLIVDDNRDQVEILDMIMRQNGYKTLRAYSAEQALEAFSSYRPDLLLLDVGMPQLDGFYVISRLRDLNGGRLPLPVIMITGSDTEESVRRGFELGARDYVIKPYDPHYLLTRIHAILSTCNKR